MGVIYLYAIRLDDEVLGKKRFRAKNPGYRAGRPCYYIGSSIHRPATRFKKHKNGQRTSWWVRDYGKYVAKRKCQRIEVSGSLERDAVERDYAQRLRVKGYGIWQN